MMDQTDSEQAKAVRIALYHVFVAERNLVDFLIF